MSRGISYESRTEMSCLVASLVLDKVLEHGKESLYSISSSLGGVLPLVMHLCKNS